MERNREIASLINDFKTGKFVFDDRALKKFSLPHRYGAGDSSEPFAFESNKFEYIPQLFRDLEVALNSLPMSKELLVDDEVGYCIPDENYLKYFLKERIGAPNLDEDKYNDKLGKYVNRSKKSIRNWVNDIITNIKRNSNNSSGIGVSSSQRCYFITGKVGCGKTTFVEYIKIVHGDRFYDNDVLFVNMNKEDFNIHNTVEKKHFSVENVSHLIRLRIFEAILRSDKCVKLLIKDDVKDDLICSLENILTDKKSSDIYERLHRYSSILKKRNFKSYEATDKAFDKNTMDALIDTLTSVANIKFLICIDGLDRYSVQDLEFTQFQLLFDSLSRIIYSRDSENNSNTYYLLALRDCTYDYFVGPYIKDHNVEPDRKKISPVEPFALIERGLKYYIYLQEECTEVFFKTNRDKLIDTFQIIYKDYIMEALEITSPYNVACLFNYNLREMLCFITDVIKLVICRVTRMHSSCPDNLLGFYNVLFEHYILQNYIKKYRILQIFILRFNDGLKNHFRLTVDGEIQILDLRNNDKRRGYLDNLYDYHLYIYQNDSNRGGLPFFLLKIRILQYLHNNYKKMNDILEMLNSRNYLIEKEELFKTLQSLIQAGLIKTSRFDDIPEICYKTSKKGWYAINIFIKTYIYNENALHASAFPNHIITFIIPMWKINVKEWVTNNIINMYMFVKYIEYLENWEYTYISSNEFDNNLSIKSWQIIHELKQNVYTSIEQILKKKIRNEHVDIGYLRRKIRGINQSLKEKNVFCRCRINNINSLILS